MIFVHVEAERNIKNAVCKNQLNMNVIFHTTAAIGVAVMLTDTRKPLGSIQRKVVAGLVAFAIGVVSHGALDYIPHCYPMNPKVDIILGSIIIVITTLRCKPAYRIIVGLSFIGSIFPDLIDLSPQILNKYLATSLPIQEKIFPWHWEQYSGSIFIEDCQVSTLNHAILVLVVLGICIMRRCDFVNMFNRQID